MLGHSTPPFRTSSFAVSHSGAMSNLLSLPLSQGLTTEAASVSRAVLDLRRGVLIQVKPEIFEPLTIPRPGQTCRRRSLRNGRSIWCRDRSIGGLPWIKTQAIGRITPRSHHDPARRPTPP